MKRPLTSGDRVLLLGGPAGPFFRLLAAELRRSGLTVDRCIFNPGDWLFGLGGASAVTEQQVLQQGPSGRWRVVVVFGVDRPVHKRLFNLFREAGIDVLCLEEGYMRPGYVSAEWNGSHFHSPLRTTNPEAGTTTDASDVLAPDTGQGHAFLAGFLATIQVAFITVVGPVVGGRWHRKRNALAEIWRWPRGAIRRKRFRRSDNQVLEQLIASRVRFRVLALQVHDDVNLVENGNGLPVAETIDRLTAAFARCAPADERFLVKIHPLDVGHLDYREIIAAAASRHGVSSRVLTVCDVPLGRAVKASCGLVTVNSTSGLSGLHHGVQTDVLGKAFYEGPGLARFCANLDDIWNTPHQPHRTAVMDLWYRIYREALVSGSFYALGARRRLARRLAQKLDLALG